MTMFAGVTRVLSLVALGAVVFLSLRMDEVGSVECGGHSVFSQIVPFELAKSRADLDRIFVPDQPCSDAFLRTMDEETKIDMVRFIPSYGLFFLLFFVSYLGTAPRAAVIGIALALIGVVSDYVEDVQLLNVTRALREGAGAIDLGVLIVAVRLKWAALAVAVGLVFLKLAGSLYALLRGNRAR